MSTENKTFGGFDILGDILTNGPDNNPNDPFDGMGDDPVVEPQLDPNEGGDDDPIIDPSQQNNTKPLKSKSVTSADPDIDPEVDPSIDPELDPKLDPEANLKPEVDSEIDLKEEEPFIVGYLQEELYNRFGWELPEGEKLEDMDSLTAFIQGIVEEGSKPNYASTELEQLNDYVENGGSLEKYLEQRYQGNVDIEKLDMSKPANQSLVLREFFKRQGYSMDKIERKLQTYGDTGVLQEEAEDAHELLKNTIKKEADTLLLEQQKIQQETIERQQKYINDVISNIDSKKEIRGIPTTPNDLKKLKDYILKTDKDGITQFQKDYNSSVDPFIEAAFFTMQGKNLVGKLNKKASSEAAKKLKEQLAAKSKRNKTIPHTSSSTDGQDYSALSSLGSALAGI